MYQDLKHLSDDHHPPLTPQGELILGALRQSACWINRTELAKRVGKSALNKWDIVLLKKLVEAALIETRQIPRNGLIEYEWQCRAVQTVEQQQ